jgi:predicted dehydrogenase
MLSDELRVGTIGMGWNAAFSHVPALRDTGRAEVVAISRRNPERLALAQEELGIAEAYTDWRKMLDQAELDAVVVSTPNYLHTEHTLAALQQGLHVLVEKPMALTSQDACAMVKAAERVGRALIVGYNARGMGSWCTVRAG